MSNPTKEYGYRPIDTSKEAKQDGDEVWNGTHWVKADKGPFVPVADYRRKHPATPPVESAPWRPIGDLTGLPEKGWVACGGATADGDDYFAWYRPNDLQRAVNEGYTHWQPIAPVPGPPKPMTEEEALAYAKLGHAAYDAERVEEGWNARKAFEKGGK